MNKELYISLIARQLSSELNSSQLQNLNSWLSKSKDNANLLNEFKQTWTATASYKQNLAIDVDSAFGAFSKKFDIPASTATVDTVPAPQKTSDFKRNAIIVLLLLMLFALGTLYTVMTSKGIANNEMKAITTYAENNAAITLSPNSTYDLSSFGNLTEATVNELNTILNDNRATEDNSSFAGKKIDVKDINANKSIESLSGQAYIDLNDNKFNAFGINGGQSIVAKNAAFNVQNYRDDNMTVIDVQSGKVIFIDDNGEAFVINEGQRAIFDKHTGELIKADNPAINPFKWHKGILVFNNTPLSEAFVLLERFYGVDIDVSSDADLDNKNFTATFPISSNLDDCLQLMNASFEMDIEKIDDRSIKITNIKGE